MPATLDEALQRLARLARDGGAPDVYLVGGSVRDALLGRPCVEADLVALDAARFAGRVAGMLGTHVVALGRAGHPLYRLPLAAGHLDVSPLAGTIAQDLARRDFTVNALALPLAALPARGLPGIDPADPALIDLHGGRVDLAARTLRAVTPAAFHDDAVRIIRAARFASTLDFTVEPATARAMAEAVGALSGVAPERISVELLRLLDAPSARVGVRVLEASGALVAFFPELAEGREVEQRPVHAFTVYRHQVVAFEQVDMLTTLLAPPRDDEAALWRGFWDARWAETRWGRLDAHVARHRAALRLATLLHDVAKPRTRTVTPGGDTRFLGHAELGAAMVGERLRALRFPGAFIDRVALLVEQHLRPGQVRSPGQAPTERALHRFHLALGDATPDVCLLFLADSLATAPDAVAGRWPAYVAHVRRIIEWRPAVPAQSARRLIDGHAIMAATGLPPGPAVGRILAAVQEAVAVGDVQTLVQAEALARRLAAET